jgi:hypothetical protein
MDNASGDPVIAPAVDNTVLALQPLNVPTSSSIVPLVAW